eukprot:1097775-Alexandrium_andersonii.AAC.1
MECFCPVSRGELATVKRPAQPLDYVGVRNLRSSSSHNRIVVFKQLQNIEVLGSTTDFRSFVFKQLRKLQNGST